MRQKGFLFRVSLQWRSKKIHDKKKYEAPGLSPFVPLGFPKGTIVVAVKEGNNTPCKKTTPLKCLKCLAQSPTERKVLSKKTLFDSQRGQGPKKCARAYPVAHL